MAITHINPRSDATAIEPQAESATATRSCQCGHVEGAHEHYRRGTDCALCPCARYRKPDRPGLRRSRSS